MPQGDVIPERARPYAPVPAQQRVLVAFSGVAVAAVLAVWIAVLLDAPLALDEAIESSACPVRSTFLDRSLAF